MTSRFPAPPTNRRDALALAMSAAVAASTLGITGLALAQEKGEIRIAHVYSKSGPLEAYGKQTATGFMMGLEYATGGTMKVNGKNMVPPVVFKDKQGDPVTLEKYSDDHHGFLRMEITDKLITGHYYTVPRPQDPYSKGSQLLDYWEFDWKKKRYVPNAL